MHNWSVDIKKLKKDKEQFTSWKLEQMINFGTDGEKIPESDIRTYWKKLTLDRDKKRFLGFLLWGEKFLTRDK